MKIQIDAIQVKPGRREANMQHIRELAEIGENFVRSDLSTLEYGDTGVRGIMRFI